MEKLSDSRSFNTHSVLESKQHNLQLADGGAVKVQLQLELRQCGGDDLPVRHANKISQTDHKSGDVLRPQLHLLSALAVVGEADSETRPIGRRSVRD